MKMNTVKEIVDHLKSLIKESKEDLIDINDTDRNELTIARREVQNYRIDVLTRLLRDITGELSPIIEDDSDDILEVSEEYGKEYSAPVEPEWDDYVPYMLIHNESGEPYVHFNEGKSYKSFNHKELMKLLSFMFNPQDYHVHYKGEVVKYQDNFLNGKEWLDLKGLV